MGLQGPNIEKVGGGLGRKFPSPRNVGAIITAKGYAVSTTFALATAYKFQSLAEAEALGLGPDTDANAAATCTALTWYHISEFFRVNPDGTLWMYSASAATASTIFGAAGIADSLLADSENSLRFLGVVLGGAPDADVTVTNGMDAEVTAMQAAAQTWVNTKAAKKYFIDDVVIEGKSLATGTPSLDLHTLESPQVSIVVGNDLGYLEPYITIDAGFAATAAVGTVLGSIGVRKLSECIGSVDIERKPSSKRAQADYSLVDTLQGRWLKPGVTSGVAVSALADAVCVALQAKGYTYMDRFSTYPGVYINDSYTCDALTSDYCTIENNRVWNEAARYVDYTLTPKIKSTVDVDRTTGFIAPTTISSWKALVNKKLETLVAEKEIDSFTCTIDPAQNVLGGDDIETELTVVPRGIARGITAKIGFDNPFNN